MRPNFEEPLDTAKQLVEKNITHFLWPGAEIWKQFLIESSIAEYRILGENTIIPNDWDHYNRITKYDVIGNGTHAIMSPFLWQEDLDLGTWYRSKEKLSGLYPYSGYLTNTKWHLNEVKVPQSVGRRLL